MAIITLKTNGLNTPNGYFSVPQYWQTFQFSNGESALLPHTFLVMEEFYQKILLNGNTIINTFLIKSM